MIDWLRVLRRALVSGSGAGIVSLVALACGGQRDCRSVFAPVNAVSHWIWRSVALGQQEPSLRYTLPGAGIHHAMSILWALLFEERIARAGSRSGPLRTIATALGVSAAACFVDLRLTPERLTPGFERRLSPESLTVVYLAFALGLALPSIIEMQHSDRRRR
ncbi:hypothetical protein [Aromatoleum aromaticum]|uniref:Transmembrane protein n=1 Tax=Aromatoleum aromaticum (strain DSM 19018 / LMG 30748 / EbN1) TaxID=76114 RepID=Q5NY21_AROAE|nr:hypothetical protein [Aromatoleum aromaticum]NMG55142.1 hypothetical protein [Aromatoleum aromaticum]CAI10043.1 hypothetical protein ebA6866 [Aromatoleum aromaticum EbN1]